MNIVVLFIIAYIIFHTILLIFSSDKLQCFWELLIEIGAIAIVLVLIAIIK